MMKIQTTVAAVTAGAALALALTACTGPVSKGGSTDTGSLSSPSGALATGTGATGTGATGTGATGTGAAKPKPSPTPKPAAIVTITPGNAKAADPSTGISVTVAGGTLKSVKVATTGDPVTGTYAANHASWNSTWALNVSQSYTVTATAIAKKTGATVIKTSTFKTLTPGSTFYTEIFEGYKETYGVGMPITLTFSQPIKNKAAVERAIELQTSKPVVGAWYWDGDETLDFRPRAYWPAHTTVSFTGHFDGVEAANGMYGFHTLTQTFNIGASVVAVASTQTHKTQIYIDGKLKYNWDVSTGKSGDDTPDGSYLTIEKANPVRMTGPGYDLLVPWSVRFTFSGDYYHDAYWSVGEQGFENVSHGCVNLSPANAETYYKLAVPGDPITIKGSPRPGTWDNGWTEWFLTWAQLLKGSATGEAVVAGPHGSTFASPKDLPKSNASYPLTTAEPGNNLW
jgi:lipoprotein-anchoring transpeptidase ErfK/SrfK